MVDLIDVVCAVLPDGGTFWFELNPEDLGCGSRLIKAWVEENPQYKESNCTTGFVQIRMPREVYKGIPATQESYSMHLRMSAN